MTGYQVEVVGQKGPGRHQSKYWHKALFELAGVVHVGNWDLTGYGTDPNFFALFGSLQQAFDFQTAVFDAGLSKAVYIVDLETGKFVHDESKYGLEAEP